MARNNVSENFEACYLKENCARKAFANKEQLEKLMNTPDFKRCVKYIANMTFKKNRSILLHHGFDHDDVTNIVRVLAMQFVNNPFEGKTKKDTYYILMNFMMQRVETFMLFLNRKFRISERKSDISIEDAVINWADQSIDLPGEEVEEQEEYVSKHMQKAKALESKVSELKTKIMRLKLELNIDAHADKLAYMATSKMVDFGVRKKARSICRKNGIDYIAWASKQVNDLDANESDFILE